MSIDVNCHMAGFVLGQFAKPLEVVGGVKAAGAESASKLVCRMTLLKKIYSSFKLSNLQTLRISQSVDGCPGRLNCRHGSAWPHLT